ncbi:MAG: hypothetical protein ACOYVK_16750 [Bacillota bacterium]
MPRRNATGGVPYWREREPVPIPYFKSNSKSILFQDIIVTNLLYNKAYGNKLQNNYKSFGCWLLAASFWQKLRLKSSGAMGTVRAFPERSGGPKGKRWNRPRGIADATHLV